METIGLEAGSSIFAATVIGLLVFCMVSLAALVIADLVRERRQQRNRCDRSGRSGLMPQVIARI